jgi:hypothetical protein
MHNDEIAPAVRELINRHIRSMDHAEAVLHLADAPGQAHEAETVAARHRWARGIAARVLAELAESGIATAVEGGYRLAADVAEGTISSLNDLYHRHPVTLVRAIYAAPVPIKSLSRPGRSDDAASDV